MAIEINGGSAICCKCGRVYEKRKNNFPVSYEMLYKGAGYIPICKDCVDSMYNAYLSQCNNPMAAARQMCRKLDLYWSERVFEAVEKKSAGNSVMRSYIAKLNSLTHSGKSYDDTLSEEGTLWKMPNIISALPLEYCGDDVPEEVVAFWGTGYTPEMYADLEQRRSYWMSRFPDGMELDIGTEAIVRQICSLELDINRDRAAGRSIEKSVNALNTLLGSASLKPVQKKGDSDSALEQTPFGVWISRWETKRPIPDVDQELQDVDGIIKYVLTWFYGHTAKMVGIKNSFSKLYEKAIDRLRVAHPEFDDEDDDSFLFDVFDGGDDDEMIMADNNEKDGDDDNE